MGDRRKAARLCQQRGETATVRYRYLGLTWKCARIDDRKAAKWDIGELCCRPSRYLPLQLERQSRVELISLVPLAASIIASALGCPRRARQNLPMTLNHMFRKRKIDVLVCKSSEVQIVRGASHTCKPRVTEDSVGQDRCIVSLTTSQMASRMRRVPNETAF